MEDEFFDGGICGEWVYVGDTQQPTPQSQTGWFSNQSFGEDMKSCFSEFKFTREEHMEHFCSII